MLTLESRGARIVARGPTGSTLWQAALVVEDEEGRHRVRVDGTGEGMAGPWRVRVDLQTTAAGLDRIGLAVSPLSERRLVRIYLQIEGGTARMPDLASPRTRVLAFRQGGLGRDGVVKLGPGESWESSLVTVVCGSHLS